MQASNKVWDVIVVGAGLAGLKAATELKKAGKNVLVLEARDRVGGRSMPGEICGQIIDLGGQWVGSQQKLLLAQAKELGVSIYPQYTKGASLLSRDNKVSSYRFNIPKLPLLSLLELLLIEQRWNADMKRLSRTPTKWADHIRQWDSQTLESWANQNVRTRAARDFIHTIVGGFFCCNAVEISYLFFLDCLQKGHGLRVMMGVKGGAQQDKFAGGAWQIPKRMADPLKEHIILNTPVVAIEQDTRHVQVICEQIQYVAKHIIITVPPVLASRISYTPPLPQKRAALLQQMKMGAVIKIHVAYPTPFWRTQGLNGSVASTDRHLSIVFDQTIESEVRGILVGLIEARHATELSNMDEDTRRQLVIADLVHYFGEQAAHPLAYVEQDWLKEEWSQGGYAAYMPPLVMSTCGDTIREPVGRMHWAGTETATEWMGYLDGALQSGIRAAKEVIIAQR